MAIAHALGVPMIGVPSLDLLAFPVRFSAALIVAAIDARRGELFHAFYRQVPGGMQRHDRPRGGHARRPRVRDARPQRGVPAGRATARCATTRCSTACARSRSPTTGSPTRAAASLVQLAHAQALREQFVKPWEIQPLYLRKPDVEINWTTRDGV